MALALGLTRTPPGPLAEAGRACMERTAQGNEPLAQVRRSSRGGVIWERLQGGWAEAEQNLASDLPPLLVPPTCR